MVKKNNDFEPPKIWLSLKAKTYAFSFTALFICLLVIYSNSFKSSWHLDDYPNIVENRNVHLKSLSFNTIKKSFYGIGTKHKKIRRPLSYLSFALNYYVHSTDVFGYHLVNFGIHFITSIFLFLLLYDTMLLPVFKMQDGPTAYSVALLSVMFWATHPIQVSAVTYIVQRMAAMAGMFYVMSMYFYLKSRTTAVVKRQIGLSLLSILAAMLAIASKENAVMVPVCILLFDMLLLQQVPVQKWHQAVRFFMLVLFTLVLLPVLMNLSSILGGYNIRPYTLYQRLLTEPRVIVIYLSLLFYPTSSRLTLLHDVEVSKSLLAPWTTLGSIAIILCLIATAVYIRRKRPLIAYSILFFFLNHLIEGSILPLELIFEHRNYIPSMFIFVPPAMLCVASVNYFSYTKSLQAMVSIAIILVVAAQGHTAYLYNEIFFNDLTLWNNNVKKSPHLHRPHHNLAKALLAAGLYEQSALEMHKALDARSGARLNQKYTTFHNLGIYYLFQNDYDKALPLFLKSLDLEPDNHKSFLAIATIMLYRNAVGAAEKYIDVAIRLNPFYAQSHYIHGLIMLKKHEIDDAINAGQKALRLDPKDHTPYFLIAEAYRLKNKLTQAVYFFTKYLDQYPGQISGHLALIELYDLLDNSSALKQSISNLMNLVDKTELSKAILRYHQKDNYLDHHRIERIVRAIQKSISPNIKGLNSILGKI